MPPGIHIRVGADAQQLLALLWTTFGVDIPLFQLGATGHQLANTIACILERLWMHLLDFDMNLTAILVH